MPSEHSSRGAALTVIQLELHGLVRAEASSIDRMVDPLVELRSVVRGTAPAATEMSNYLAKVRDSAFAVTDQDVEALREAGISEDVIFEQTVAVAIAEGLRRLDRASEVIG